jgi:hypothetical protein
VKLVTRHEPERVLEILSLEVDPYPSLLRCVLTLNAHYFVGRSAVCGRITKRGFELRSRKGPAFSLRADGTLSPAPDGGSEITLRFRKPIIPEVIGVLVFQRYQRDRDGILSFLTKHVGAVAPDSPT